MLSNVVVKDKAAIADMMAILADMEQSRDCAELLVSGKYKDDMRVQRALYESALISYRRAIGGSSSRLPELKNTVWKFPNAVKARAIKGLETEDKQIRYITDKCVAHRAIPEARIVEVNDTGGEIATSKYRERMGLMPALQKITDKYVKILQTELIPSELRIQQS